MAAKRIVCKHCGQSRYPKQRGLCWTCSQDPAVRNRYPSTSKFARRGVRNFNGATELPPKPTAALAGSAAKLRVLEERAALGVSLWHPDDSGQPDLAVLASQHGNPRKGRHKRETYATR